MAKSIGFFDSGVGGLSIWKEVTKLLPSESTIYVADQEGFPYGEKTQKEVMARADEITKFLISKGVKAIVVACNSATAAAIEDLRSKYNIPFIGTEPVIKPAAEESIKKRVAILATPMTVKSTRHKKLIKTHGVGVEILSIPCEELAEQVEKDLTDSTAINKILTKCISKLRGFDADVLGLSCTHYSLIKDDIAKFLGSEIKVIDPAEAVAKRLKLVLGQRNNLEKNDTSEHLFYTTGNQETFSNQYEQILGIKPLALEKLVLYTDRQKN